MTPLLPENMFGRLTKLLRFGLCYWTLAATNFLLAAVGFGRSWLEEDFPAVLFAMGLTSFLGGLIIISNCLHGIRIDRSTVTLAQESIQVKDHRGRIWRDIPYTSITAVKKESHAGSFGYARKPFRTDQIYDPIPQDYICVYLNGNETAPDAFIFHRFFKSPDFLPIGFDQAVYDQLRNCLLWNQLPQHSWMPDS